MDSLKKLTQQLFITSLFVVCLIFTVQQSHADGAGTCKVDSDTDLCEKTGASCTTDSGDEGKCKSYLQRGCKCLKKKKPLNSLIIKEKKPGLGITKKPISNTIGLIKPITKEPVLQLPKDSVRKLQQ